MRDSGKWILFALAFSIFCQAYERGDQQLPVMSQSPAIDGDGHKTQGSNGGLSVGSGISGYVDGTIGTYGIAIDGKEYTCCNDIWPPASHDVHGADAVFYNRLAYDAQPDDPRLRDLLYKMTSDEVLTDSELKELEVLRMPFADEHLLHSPDLSQAWEDYKVSKVSKYHQERTSSA